MAKLTAFALLAIATIGANASAPHKNATLANQVTTKPHPGQSIVVTGRIRVSRKADKTFLGYMSEQFNELGLGGFLTTDQDEALTVTFSVQDAQAPTHKMALAVAPMSDPAFPFLGLVAGYSTDDFTPNKHGDLVTGSANYAAFSLTGSSRAGKQSTGSSLFSYVQNDGDYNGLHQGIETAVWSYYPARSIGSLEAVWTNSNGKTTNQTAVLYGDPEDCVDNYSNDCELDLQADLVKANSQFGPSLPVVFSLERTDRPAQCNID